MSLVMSKEEREAFLADVHIGVVSIAEEGRGPLTVPVWYDYQPGGDLRIATDRGSRKGKLLARGGRFSLLAQVETPPYKYVSVEGRIVSIEQADIERDMRPIARRYLGKEGGDGFIEKMRSELADTAIFRMRPERWLTSDYSKE